MPDLLWRSAAAAFCALIVTCLLLPFWRKFLIAYRLGQPVSTYTPVQHRVKSGTPTMGGVVIMLSTLIAAVCFGHWHSLPLPLLSGVMLLFGGLGAYDDWAKIRASNNRGLSALWKYTAQSVIALLVLFIWVWFDHHGYCQHLWIPHGGLWFWPFGIFLGFGYCVIVGSSNAVNLTDGLDGLATTIAIIVTIGLLGLGFLCVSPSWLTALMGFSMPDMAEVCVFLSALLGSGCGFLCFNAYPAQIFMGDSGSLPLGAVLGTAALLLRVELLFFFLALVFVIEACSVMLQVTALRLSHRRFRFFRMAPIHHHFELMGWHEQQIVARFAVFSVLMLLVVFLFCL